MKCNDAPQVTSTTITSTTSTTTVTTATKQGFTLVSLVLDTLSFDDLVALGVTLDAVGRIVSSVLSTVLGIDDAIITIAGAGATTDSVTVVVALNSAADGRLIVDNDAKLVARITRRVQTTTSTTTATTTRNCQPQYTAAMCDSSDAQGLERKFHLSGCPGPLTSCSCSKTCLANQDCCVDFVDQGFTSTSCSAPTITTTANYHYHCHCHYHNHTYHYHHHYHCREGRNRHLRHDTATPPFVHFCQNMPPAKHLGVYFHYYF
jgi:hypothetical protein